MSADHLIQGVLNVASATFRTPCLIPAADAAPRRLRLRSANLNRLTVHRCRLSTYGCRAFYHAGRQSGTRCQMNLEITTVLMALNDS